MEEDNYDQKMSRKGRRCKSHSIFGALELFRWAHQSKSDRRRNSKIEISDQTTITINDQQQRNAAKRHHSVSFAPINVTTVFPGGNNNNNGQNNNIQNNNNKLLGNRRNYSSSCRHPTSLHNSGGAQHHHGSVMSLVMARKNACTGAGGAKMMARRPSTPSLPMSIVHAVSNTLPFNKHNRVRKAMSMLSLDGDDSAFVSECSSSSSASSTFSSSSSSSSKRDSGLSTTKVEDELPPSPWKFEQYNNSGRNGNNEDEDELDEDQFATSIGHLMASRPRIALQHLRIAQHDRTVLPAAEEVLCAEGNTQAYLLSLVAPPGKRVVNIGRTMGDNGIAAATEATRECRRRHSEHRLLKYNLNNLNPCD